MADPVMLSATFIRSSLERDGVRSLPLLERAKACFKATDNDSYCWMLASDDQRFRAGCGALLLLSEGDERSRIETELKMLRGLSAAMSGLPIDMAALVPDGFEAVGLMALYRERAA